MKEVSDTEKHKTLLSQSRDWGSKAKDLTADSAVTITTDDGLIRMETNKLVLVLTSRAWVSALLVDKCADIISGIH